MSRTKMEKFYPGPGAWHWLITADDIEKIKANDRETINRVYFANYAKFGRIAGAFVSRRLAIGVYIDRGLVKDVLQQVYIDLPSYDFTDTGRLVCDLRKTCWRIMCGQSVFADSLDAEVYGDDDGFEHIPADNSLDEALEREESEKAVLRAIALQPLKTSQKDVLTALALWVKPFAGLFTDEYRRAFGGAK